MKAKAVSLLLLLCVMSTGFEAIEGYTPRETWYKFTSASDPSNSWGRERVVYVPTYPIVNEPFDEEADPEYVAHWIQVNSESAAFDGDWETYVEGKSVEPVWGVNDELLCGKTGWLYLRLPQRRSVNQVVYEYTSALAGKAITIQVYNYWSHSWVTVVHNIAPETESWASFRPVTTDRVRVRIETGEDGPLSWSGDFSVHGAYIYEIQVGLKR